MLFLEIKMLFFCCLEKNYVSSIQKIKVFMKNMY